MRTKHTAANSCLTIQIDILMGCSRSILLQVSHITDTAKKRNRILRTRPLTSAETEEFMRNSSQIELALNHIVQYAPKSSVRPAELEKIAETKRLAALLYLRTRLGKAAQGMHDPLQKQLAAEIVAHLTELPNTTTLLWPLFVVGTTSAVEDEEHRRFVLERLLKLQRVRELGSVRKARAIVEGIFKEKDLGRAGTWEEMVIIRANSISLA
jgi:hypothetical protein